MTRKSLQQTHTSTHRNTHQTWETSCWRL